MVLGAVTASFFWYVNISDNIRSYFFSHRFLDLIRCITSSFKTFFYDDEEIEYVEPVSMNNPNKTLSVSNTDDADEDDKTIEYVQPKCNYEYRVDISSDFSDSIIYIQDDEPKFVDHVVARDVKIDWVSVFCGSIDDDDDDDIEYVEPVSMDHHPVYVDVSSVFCDTVDDDDEEIEYVEPVSMNNPNKTLFVSNESVEEDKDEWIYDVDDDQDDSKEEIDCALPCFRELKARGVTKPQISLPC